MWVHLGQSIGGPDSANDVFSGGPDACDLVLFVHFSPNHVATEVHYSKCGDRKSAFAHVRRDATASPSGHWLRVATKATPQVSLHIREGLALEGDTRSALSGCFLGTPRELPGVFNGILVSSSLS